ncbi:hypothetical protein [Arcanobacterium bovis]|uniref:Uncharacterized protein n=1 Tax=Arcanobacterium bovis TaxID=2529275 RepID=A0A4Q9UYJ0_9ACTO|nr:hypothetical protein [Arcanobacterium bovis]TBW20714.1 hypothetical protein EZJ44_08465 [Arcanobacterium bovis]
MNHIFLYGTPTGHTSSGIGIDDGQPLLTFMLKHTVADQFMNTKIHITGDLAEYVQSSIILTPETPLLISGELISDNQEYLVHVHHIALDYFPQWQKLGKDDHD